MGRIGRTVCINGIVGVAMISNDHHLVVGVLGGLHYGFYAVVNRMHSLQNCLVHAGVSHHVAVGKVQTYKVVFTLSQSRRQFVGHLISTHFWLQIVSRHLGARHQNAVFTIKHRFASAIEEERHMRVFFRLRDAQLLESLLGNPLSDRIGHVFLREKHMYARERRVIRRHRGKEKIQRLHAFDFGLRKYRRQFFGAIVAEIDENDRVTRLNATDRTSLHVHTYVRFHEFVGHAFVIGSCHGILRVGVSGSLPLDQQIIGFTHALPALVAIHSVIAADKTGHRPGQRTRVHLFFNLAHKAKTALGIRVAAIHESMHITLFHPFALSKRQKRFEMFERRMHAAVGEKPHHVQCAARAFHMIDDCADFRVLSQRMALRILRTAGTVDLDKALIDHAAGTDVEMPHLGVPHLAFGKAHIFAIGTKSGVRSASSKLLNESGMTSSNGIRLGAVTNSPAV